MEDGNVNGGTSQDIYPHPDTIRKKLVPHQKRKRKVNTCLACKARKVKCDRQKPQCGPCTKTYNERAAAYCLWAETFGGDADDQAVENQIGSNGSNGGPSSNWNQFPTQNNTSTENQALLQRIVRLESALQRSGATLDPDPSLGNEVGMGNQPEPEPEHEHEHEHGVNPSEELNRHWNYVGPDYQDFNDGSFDFSSQSAIRDSFRFPFGVKYTEQRARDILNWLPSTVMVDFMMDRYARIEKTHLNAGLSWRLIFMQQDILRKQLEETTNLDPRIVPKDADFSFIALTFAIMACSAEFFDMVDFRTLGLGTTEESAVETMEFLICLSEACLCMADFLARPNLNILMTLALLRQYYSARSIPTVRTLLAMSIRLAQSLGIHKLGTAKEDEARWIAASAEENRRAMAERIDPINSRPSGTIRGRDVEVKLLSNMSNLCGIASVYTSSGIVDRSHLVRETARRLWANLVVADYYVSSGFGDDQCQIHRYTTGLPLNIDERDLPDHTGDEPFLLPQELPPGAPSESSIYPYSLMIVNVGKEASRMADENGRFTFEQTMEIDSNFRKIFDSLPVFLRLDGFSEHLPEVKAQLESRPYLASQRLFLHESIFNRLTLLHRHFLTKGHRDSQYEESTRQCVKAAKMVLYCRREMDRIAPQLMSFFVFRIHVFMSVAALSIHLIELARQQITSPESAEIRQEINEALEFLNSSGPRGAKVPPPKASNDVIDALLRAETQIQSNDAASSQKKAATSKGKGKGKAKAGSNANQKDSGQEDESNALDSILSPNDPLNIYINSLLDPSNSNTDLSPPNFFDSLDGFMPNMPTS